MVKITFFSNDMTIETSSGQEFLEVSAKNPNLPIKFGCRRGNCGICAIHVLEGAKNLTRQSTREIEILHKKKLDPAVHRLACQCAFNGDILISSVEG